MMRLLIATPFLETKGGMERVVLRIARHFGASIHCMYYDRENTFDEFRGLDVQTAKPSFLSKLPIGRRVATAADVGRYFYNVRLEGYDIINAHQTPSEWIRNRNSPVIWYCHTPNREAFDLYEWRMNRRNILSKALFRASIEAFKQLEFRTVPKIEYIFTNSRNSQDRIKKFLKRDSEILYPGVDASRFSSRPAERYFFYPSRIAPEKELEFAIEAFKLFSKREAGWKLVIAGGLSRRPEHQAYLKRIRSLCTPEISIETNISEERLLDLYSRCSSVLYTPVNEDFGIVPLEAMASGKPCIARNEGGPRETVIDGTDGYLVGSVWEMSEKMSLISKNPDKAERMGKAGRTKVGRDFTWDRFLKRFSEKTAEIVDSAGSAKKQ